MPFAADSWAFARDFASVEAHWTVRVRAMARFALHQAHRAVRRRPLIARWEGMWLELPLERTPAARAYYFGRPDRWEFAFMEQFLRRGDLVVDIGANDGVTALFAGRLAGAAGEVIAVERDLIALDRLTNNVALNDMEQVTIVSPERDDGALPALTEVCGDRDPALIVIEASGEEAAVLAGAEALMARGTPLAWLLEMRRDRPAESGYVAALLERRGYRFCVYDVRTNTLRRRDWRNPHSLRLLAVRDVELATTRIREELPIAD